jgi:HD-like signal output (HDOD) protein
MDEGLKIPCMSGPEQQPVHSHSGALVPQGDTLDRNADRIVRETGIAPCPSVLTRLLRETREEEPDFRRVAQLIGADVALASAVLAVVNSPFYGLRTKASSVQQALTLLGLSSVTQLVTGLLLRQAFSCFAGPLMERYWKRSMATAMICSLLCRETGKGEAAVAGTYGLFRDCGMPVMLQRFPIYADIFDGSALVPGEPPLELENERYATNHACVGLRLARNWHLPASMSFAILRHHDVLHSEEARARAQPGPLALVAIGLAADHLFCRASGAQCAEWEIAGEWTMSALEVSANKLTELVSRVGASIKRL